MPLGLFTLPFSVGAAANQGKRVFNKGNQIAMGSAGNGLRNFIAQNQGAPEQAAPPQPSPEEVQRLANEQLLEQLQRQMYIDQSRLAASTPPAYPGKSRSNMSDLKQNERALREQYRGKVPKQGKIENLLRKEAQGFTPQQRRSIVNMLGREGKAEELITRRLNKEFANNYGYEGGRENRIRGKVQKDLARDMTLTEGNLKGLEEQLKTSESGQNLKNIEALKKAGMLKGARREAHFNTLGEFANQKHAHGNLKLKSERDAFDEEVNAPYQKLAMAQRALEGVNAEEMHPDKAKMENAILQKINNAYNAPYQAYPGQRVVDMDPEVESSYRLAQMISPKYKDEFAADRKAMEQGFQNNSLASQVYDKLPGAVEPAMSNIDEILRRQLKKVTGEIGGHYARQGTYGSGAHKTALEKALRETASLGTQEREGALSAGIKGQEQLLKKQADNDLSRYGMMGEQGAQEFGALIDQLKGKNKQGWEKTQNKQGAENEAMRAWYGQVANEWPSFNRANNTALGDQAYKEGLETGRGNITNPWMAHAKQYGNNFQELFRQQQLFDEDAKDYNAYSTEQQRIIRDKESAQRAIDAQKRQEANQRLKAQMAASKGRPKWMGPVPTAAPVVQQAVPAAPTAWHSTPAGQQYREAINLYGRTLRDNYRDPNLLSYMANAGSLYQPGFPVNHGLRIDTPHGNATHPHVAGRFFTPGMYNNMPRVDLGNYNSNWG